MDDRKLGITQRDYEDWWYSKAGQDYIRQFKQIQIVKAQQKQDRIALYKLYTVISLWVLAALGMIALVGFMIYTAGRRAPSPIPSPPNPGEQTALADSICNYFVSTTAAATGDGSFEDPFPWDTIINGGGIVVGVSNTKPVSDGAGGTINAHVVCPRGGTYAVIDTTRIVGTETNPVVLRAYPGERVIIDGSLAIDYTSQSDSTAYVWLWNIEVTNSDTTAHEGDDAFQYALWIEAEGIRIINSYIHDASKDGIGFWRLAKKGGWIYGNMIYNNGFGATEEPYAHNIYSQNDSTLEDLKTIMDNFIGPADRFQMQIYTASGEISRYRVRRNVFYLCGVANKAAIIRGGAGPVGYDNVVDSNMTQAFNTNLNRAAYNESYCFQFGKTGGTPGSALANLDFKDNYLADRGLYIIAIDSLTMTGNTIATSLFWLSVDTTVSTGKSYWSEPPYDIDGNTWFLPDTSTGWRTYFLQVDQGYTGFAAYTALTGYDDATSTAEPDSTPSTNKVFAYANLYEDGRGNIIVYNWEGLDTVNVDVSGILNDGDDYEVISIMDLWGDPIVSGTWTSPDSLPVPMTSPAMPTPIRGWTGPSGLDPGDPWRWEGFIIRRPGTG